MENMKGTLVSVVGPTAVGKTSFGIALARHFGTEIISVDSRQFYREMNIGTAKPDEAELSSAKHHFVNTLSVHEEYSVGMFEKEALHMLESLFDKYKVVIAVGGSGLFFKAIWEGFDEMPKIKEGIRAQLNEELQNKGLPTLLEELKEKDETYYNYVDQQNWQRVIRALEVIRSTDKAFSSFRKDNKSQDRFFDNIKIGLELEREILFDKINQRMDTMIDLGLFDEAKLLFPLKNMNALQTVGYSEIFEHLEGSYDYQEAVRLLKRNSRRYAKRQMTWFKKDQSIQWHSPKEIDKVIRLIEEKVT
ncbi:MAG: tRNA (adenosine(37)-N6)-dimethylallyltransferase MiaA [Cyclobacteriaceae bacterium]